MYTQQLPEGFKVEFTHFRCPEANLRYLYHRDRGFPYQTISKMKPLPNGGATLCTIRYEDRIWRGKATCSNSDQFSYRYGRELAFQRAISLANLGITRVRYAHFRPEEGVESPLSGPPRYYKGSGVLPCQNGGVTHCEVIVGDERFYGEAYCSPEDAFCYKTGRDLALFRAKFAVMANVRRISPILGNHAPMQQGGLVKSRVYLFPRMGNQYAAGLVANED